MADLTKRIRVSCPCCHRTYPVDVRFGDRETTADIVASWSERVMEDPRPAVAFVAPRTPKLDGWDLVLKVLTPEGPRPMTVPIVIGEVRQMEDDQEEWGLIRLGPGVWKLSPSIISGDKVLHGYVTLVDVPEPAPFLPKPAP